MYWESRHPYETFTKPNTQRQEKGDINLLPKPPTMREKSYTGFIRRVIPMREGERGSFFGDGLVLSLN